MTTPRISITPRQFWTLVILAGMALGTPAFWFFVIIGGSPIDALTLGAVNRDGVVSTQFRAGDLVQVKRRICSSRAIGVQFFPALKSEDGVLYALPGAVSQVHRGCRPSNYGFVMPPLPPGRYTYISSIKFQNNLVGRDEHATFPPLALEVLP